MSDVIFRYCRFNVAVLIISSHERFLHRGETLLAFRKSNVPPISVSQFPKRVTRRLIGYRGARTCPKVAPRVGVKLRTCSEDNLLLYIIHRGYICPKTALRLAGRRPLHYSSATSGCPLFLSVYTATRKCRFVQVYVSTIRH